ncbi:MAG: substrate-binding domain-containing protein [Deltaproteobacteria bacterium]|nr:substrate-binding domain-containing protein [Deltaproteobacteria bacterium]
MRGTLLLAGSGSNVALTRELVSVCTPEGAATPTVADSIGSTGGVRALIDGAIDAALISRPLHPDERRHGLEVIAYARVPVVVAAHPDVPPVQWQPADLVAVYAGRHPTWPDGQPLVVLQREPGDSGHLAVARALPEFARVDDDNAQRRRWRTVYHDAALLQAVARAPGALGLSDLATIRLQGANVAVPALAGQSPGAAALAARRWPFYKDLSVVLAPGAAAEVRRLARCFRGPLARPVLLRADALGL